MKHLFIINPVARKIKGKVEKHIHTIETFFSDKHRGEFEIYVTRWSRDAIGFLHKYLENCEQTLRIHAYGGSGTHFEVASAIAGFSNVELALYPMGKHDSFLRYFGESNRHLFSSLEHQTTCGTMKVNFLSSASDSTMAHVTVGFEASCYQSGDVMAKKTGLPDGFCFKIASLRNLLTGTNINQKYKVELDGVTLDGYYTSLFISNTPRTATNIISADCTELTDNLLDLYITPSLTTAELIGLIFAYSSGDYDKFTDRIVHYQGHKVKISSEQAMCIAYEGELFYDDEVEVEISPQAINFVVPTERGSL